MAAIAAFGLLPVPNSVVHLLRPRARMQTIRIRRHSPGCACRNKENGELAEPTVAYQSRRSVPGGGGISCEAPLLELKTAIAYQRIECDR